MRDLSAEEYVEIERAALAAMPEDQVETIMKGREKLHLPKAGPVTMAEIMVTLGCFLEQQWPLDENTQGFA